MSNSLTVHIRSFAYKNGVPDAPHTHGEGYVFDCRAIHNPGRYAEYIHLTGRDEPVKTFLKERGEAAEFLQQVYALVDFSVVTYLRRGFDHLSVNFGCTGGQHRSVYCADQLAAHLKDKFQLNVELIHAEQERKGWKN
ncbi:MAG: RNase adapter RapZ [Bacteroidota bacterium]